MKLIKKLFLAILALIVIPSIGQAKEPQLLDIAQDVWQIIEKEKFEYGGASTIPADKKIDCSSYVTWVLYELGFTEEFSTQRTTKYFYETDFNEKYKWEEIEVGEKEDVTSKLEAGDILVRDDGTNNGHILIVAKNESGTIYAYSAGKANDWLNSNGEPIDMTTFAKSDNRAGKIIRIGEIEYPQVVKEMPVCNNKGTFSTYDLSDEQLSNLASIAYEIGGSVENAANEASLLANLFEIKGGGYGSGAEGLYNYVHTSGWVPTSFLNGTTSNQSVLSAVRTVLVDGKRTLPKYIDESDILDDFAYLTNGSFKFRTPTNFTFHNLYEPYVTELTNKYGASYTFYNFNDDETAIYGYKDKELRTKYKDDCYQYSLSITDTKDEKSKESNPGTSVTSILVLFGFLTISTILFIILSKKNYFRKI